MRNRREALDLVQDLASLYGWEHPTPGVRLSLARSFAGHTRVTISAVAADLNRTKGSLSPTVLREALVDLRRRKAAPDPLEVANLPTHPLDCQCGGTGVMLDVDGLAPVDRATGEVRSSKRYTASSPCPGNGGRRMNRAQAERLDAERHARAAAAGTDPDDDYRASLARARAALNSTDDERPDHDPAA